MKIGIVGAGLAGLSCADELGLAGHGVALFDKGRGPGGRMSTRRIATALGEVSFDHGAPYFTARDHRFRDAVAAWEQQGLVQQWPAAGPDAWIGVPRMNAVVKRMASRHEVHWNTFAHGLLRDGRGWHVATDSGLHGPFDAMIVATPAEQAVSLLSLHDLEMARAASVAKSNPCWVGAFIFSAPLPVAVDKVRDRGAVALAIRNSAKPQRGSAECWVVHGDAPWSIAHLEASAQDVASLLLDGLLKALALPPTSPLEAVAHRWRYAHPSGRGPGPLWNPSIGLGACGDWVLGPGAECAWLSGHDLARLSLNPVFSPPAALRA